MVFENICNSIQWQIAENGSMDGGTGLQTDDIQFHFFFEDYESTRSHVESNEHHRRHRIAVERIFHANKEADGHTMEDREL